MIFFDWGKSVLPKCIASPDSPPKTIARVAKGIALTVANVLVISETGISIKY